MKAKKIFMMILVMMGFVIAKAQNYPAELVLVSQPVMTYNNYDNTITLYYDVQNIGDVRYKGYVYIYLDPDDGYYYAKTRVKVCPGRIKRIAIDIPAYRPNPSWTYTVMPYYSVGPELYSFTTFEYFDPLTFRWNGPRTEIHYVTVLPPRPRYYRRPCEFRFYYDGYRPPMPPPMGYGPGAPMPPHHDPMHHTYQYHYNNGGYPVNHPEHYGEGYTPIPNGNSQATVRPSNPSNTPGSMSSRDENNNNGARVNNGSNNGATSRPNNAGTTNNLNGNGASSRPNNSGTSSSSNVNRPSSGNSSSSGRTGTGSNNSGSVNRPSSGNSSSSGRTGTGSSNSGSVNRPTAPTYHPPTKQQREEKSCQTDKKHTSHEVACLRNAHSCQYHLGHFRETSVKQIYHERHTTYIHQPTVHTIVRHATQCRRKEKQQRNADKRQHPMCAKTTDTTFHPSEQQTFQKHKAKYQTDSPHPTPCSPPFHPILHCPHQTTILRPHTSHEKHGHAFQMIHTKNRRQVPMHKPQHYRQHTQRPTIPPLGRHAHCQKHQQQHPNKPQVISSSRIPQHLQHQ